MITDLATALASPDILARIDTIGTIVQDPSGSRPALVSITIDPKTQLVARLWAMIAISQIGDDEHGLATTALIQNLSAPEPIIRRCASETLGLLKVASAVAQIAHHLDDGAAIPDAWSMTLRPQLRRPVERLNPSAHLKCVFRRDPISVPAAFDQRSG